MKNILLSILMVIPILTFAQTGGSADKSIFKGFISAGLNISQIGGDLIAGYKKPGGTFGVGTFIMYNEHWSNSLEITYSMKGSQNTLNPKNITNYVKFAMDYVEIPIQVNYHDFDVAIFHAGFTVGRLIRNNVTSPASGVIEVNARDWSFGATAGVTFRIKEHFGVNLKGTFSIMNALKGQFTYNSRRSQARNGGWYHNVVAVRGFYFF